MELWDSHMHTPLCKHAVGVPSDYAHQAVRMGLDGMIFTCHNPMPLGFWPEVRMTRKEFDTYRIMVGQAREEFAGCVHILLGLESDFFPGTEDWVRGLHEEAELDYVLGSVHWQGPEYRAKYGGQCFESEVKTYFELLALSAESGMFDALSHSDLIKNLSPSEWSPVRFSAIMEKALDRIAVTGVAMEINTSGRGKKLPEFNPGPHMLRLMCERNIPIVLGSDSHTPRRVGEFFTDAIDEARIAGYDSLLTFRKRESITHKLPLKMNCPTV